MDQGGILVRQDAEQKNVRYGMIVFENSRRDVLTSQGNYLCPFTLDCCGKMHNNFIILNRKKYMITETKVAVREIAYEPRGKRSCPSSHTF